MQLGRHGRCGEHDTHGDDGDYARSCKKGLPVAADAGDLKAALTGNHGWSRRDKGVAPVSVTLRVVVPISK